MNDENIQEYKKNQNKCKKIMNEVNYQTYMKLYRKINRKIVKIMFIR
jgi:hypothetical protein